MPVKEINTVTKMLPKGRNILQFLQMYTTKARNQIGLIINMA